MLERYFEINRGGHNIRCKLCFEKGRDIRNVIILVHGFAGHKDSASAYKLSERAISKHPSIATVAFDLPCHGNDVKKKLTLDDCLAYISLVSEYVSVTFPCADQYAYGNSFGGYLLLEYLKRFQSIPFTKIVLRAPAVNIYESLTSRIIREEDLQKIEKGKTVPVGFDRKVNTDSVFLSELRAEDIQSTDYTDYADDILIIHGTDDEIIPFGVSAKFADDNIIEMIRVDGADHRFQHPVHNEIATKAMLSFFGLS